MPAARADDEDDEGEQGGDDLGPDDGPGPDLGPRDEHDGPGGGPGFHANLLAAH